MLSSLRDNSQMGDFNWALRNRWSTPPRSSGSETEIIVSIIPCSTHQPRWHADQGGLGQKVRAEHSRDITYWKPWVSVWIDPHSCLLHLTVPRWIHQFLYWLTTPWPISPVSPGPPTGLVAISADSPSSSETPTPKRALLPYFRWQCALHFLSSLPFPLQ